MRRRKIKKKHIHKRLMNGDGVCNMAACMRRRRQNKNKGMRHKHESEIRNRTTKKITQI